MTEESSNSERWKRHQAELSAVLDTNWHHAVATIDRSDSIKLYIDKKLVAGTNISGNSNTFNAPGGDLMSGNCTHINEPFKGYIDDIRIYKGRALSAKTVCDLYDLTSTSLEKVSNKKAISIYTYKIVCELNGTKNLKLL